MKQVFKKFTIAVGLAALVGYLTGLLTAPKSGKETREDIKTATINGKAEAEKQLKKVVAELGELLDEAKSKGADLNDKAKAQLDELVAKAKTAREKAREVVSAVHEGDAEDEDLKVAVNEATRDLKHLRDYLQK